MSIDMRSSSATEKKKARTPAESISTKTLKLRAAAMVALSSVGAFTISALQQKALGDQPLVMLMLGCVLAFAAGALRLAPAWLSGLCAMAGFPIWAIIDLALNGGHSLLPFEFLFYAVYALIGSGLAYLGVGLARFTTWLLRARS